MASGLRQHASALWLASRSADAAHWQVRFTWISTSGALGRNERGGGGGGPCNEFVGMSALPLFEKLLGEDLRDSVGVQFVVETPFLFDVEEVLRFERDKRQIEASGYGFIDVKDLRVRACLCSRGKSSIRVVSSSRNATYSAGLAELITVEASASSRIFALMTAESREQA